LKRGVGGGSKEGKQMPSGTKTPGPANTPEAISSDVCYPGKGIQARKGKRFKKIWTRGDAVILTGG